MRTVAGRRRGVLLWVLAVLLTLAAARYQRATGPSHDLDGAFEIEGQEHGYALPRSAISGEEASVSVPAAGGATGGELLHRRYPSTDEVTAIPLQREGDALIGRLPTQPPAGKVEYRVLLETETGAVELPVGGETVILRYRGHVPLGVLRSHILLIFIALLVGVRAALSALAQPETMRRYAWVALAFMSVGGMILGPVVQKYAFGAFWTGFPFGYDLTDNKTLIMWLAWLAACAFIGLRPHRRDGPRRAAVVLASLVMIVVYLIPHSLRGSELDYQKLDEGVSAEEAVTTAE